MLQQIQLDYTGKKIFQCIHKFYRDYGRSASRREIMKEEGISSSSRLQTELEKIQEKGWIKLLGNVDYDIRLCGVPLLGRISAGRPIENFAEPNQWLEVEPKYIDTYNYALLVRGESMIEDGIVDGDYIVVRSQDTCQNGEIVVAAHVVNPFEATLKRFFQEGDRVRLQSTYNREVEHEYTRIIKGKEWDNDWRIQGIAIKVHRDYVGKKRR